MDSFRRKSWAKSFRDFIHWASLLLCASPLGAVVPAAGERRPCRHFRARSRRTDGQQYILTKTGIGYWLKASE